MKISKPPLNKSLLTAPFYKEKLLATIVGAVSVTAIAVVEAVPVNEVTTPDWASLSVVTLRTSP
jgi:hypothetical protein